MRKKIKIILYCFIILGLFYEGYYYISFKSNSYLGIRGSELNSYKDDFVLIVNDKRIDTLNINIPLSYSKGQALCFGKNIIQLKGLNSAKSFETNIYFYGLFTWNILEVTSKDFIFDSYYFVPPME